MVMDRLRNLDRVAYIRYASVYRDFQDIESFEMAVKDLREGNHQLALPQLTSGATRRRRRRTTIRPVSPHRPPDTVPEGNIQEGNNHHPGSSGIIRGEEIDE
jgi:hypothetical protein